LEVITRRAHSGGARSFGYAMNRLGSGTGLADRGQALVDAAYRALGYRRAPSGGMWYL